MTLRTLNYGIFLIMGNAGFCPSAVVYTVQDVLPAAETTPGDKDCPDPLHEKHRS